MLHSFVTKLNLRGKSNLTSSSPWKFGFGNFWKHEVMREREREKERRENLKGKRS